MIMIMAKLAEEAAKLSRADDFSERKTFVACLEKSMSVIIFIMYTYKNAKNPCAAFAKRYKKVFIFVFERKLIDCA